MKTIDQSVHAFSKDNTPFCHAEPGEVLLFKTLDCFGGQITREDQLVETIDFSCANPAAGPVYIDGAEVGDVLAVDILDIKVDENGFACSMGGVGPLADKSELRTKLIKVIDGVATFNDVKWNVEPMIGVIGTAPDGDDVVCGFAGNHGGNMDSKKITKGVTVYLPVRVPGALLQIGDLHASMGDGEISGTGIEISGQVIAKTSLIKNFELNWPVTETKDKWYVNATAPTFEEVLKLGTTEMARLMEPVYGWDMTDIFIYFTVQGDIEMNQSAFPATVDMFTTRFGIPKLADKERLIK